MRLIDAEALIQDAEPDLTWKMLSYINSAETVETEQVRHGTWVNEHSEFGDCFYNCSECGIHIDAYFYDVRDYCPKCGAKMDGLNETD